MDSEPQHAGQLWSGQPQEAAASHLSNRCVNLTSASHTARLATASQQVAVKELLLRSMGQQLLMACKSVTT